MDNYFTSFCLFIHLGVTNIGATEIFFVLNKNTIIGYKYYQVTSALSLGTSSCKKNVATVKTAHQAKKQCDFE